MSNPPATVPSPQKTLDWVGERLYHQDTFDRHQLAANKDGSRIAVVFPARNEAATVGGLVAAVRQELITDCALVDEVIVIDSDSTDTTAATARAAGATVYQQHTLLPEHGHRTGKGEALWKSLAATDADLIVFCDADLIGFDPQLLVGLLGPLLTDETVGFVKACYDRTLNTGTTIQPTGGGRVTELVARPLLNLWFPQLAGFIQPLAGEYAARKTVLDQIPFGENYTVEALMLIDIEREFGLASMAQVDCGRRQHRHATDSQLGVMSAQIHQAVLRRAGARPPEHTPDSRETTLLQFQRVAGEFVPQTVPVLSRERPPFGTLR